MGGLPLPTRPFFFMSAYHDTSLPLSSLMLNLPRHAGTSATRSSSREEGLGVDGQVASLHEPDEPLARRDRVPAHRRPGLLILSRRSARQ